MARLRYETEYNRKITNINDRLNTLNTLNPQANPQELMSEFSNIPEVKDILQNNNDSQIRKICEDQKLSFLEKISELKKIIKTKADFRITEQTDQKVELMKKSFCSERILQKKEKKAQETFECLVAEIKTFPEYNLSSFITSLPLLSKEALQSKLNEELENQPHSNESDVISRLTLHRATAWYLSENGGWRKRRNHAADIKENTIQKIVNNLVSECQKLENC